MKLNVVEIITEFPHEFEINYSLIFLAILLILNNEKLDVKVYLKPANKKDLINFYSHHN